MANAENVVDEVGKIFGKVIILFMRHIGNKIAGKSWSIVFDGGFNDAFPSAGDYKDTTSGIEI